MLVQGTDAIAFEAAAALETYEEQLAALRCARTGPGGIASMQTALRRICGVCLCLPQLSTATLAVLLAHHRLLADLARAGMSPAAGWCSASFDAVEQSVRVLQRKCRELFLAPQLQQGARQAGSAGGPRGAVRLTVTCGNIPARQNRPGARGIGHAQYDQVLTDCRKVGNAFHSRESPV